MEKVILITGTSSGFGKLTAQTMAKDGHKVYASMRDVDGKNSEVAKELENLDNVNVLELDVTSEESVNNAVKTIIDKEGKLDVVVNNAGTGQLGITEAFTIEQTKKVFDVNTLGSLRVIRAVLPQMRNQKSGLIIQISSVVGRIVMPYFGAYIASKFAVEAFAQTFNMELAPLGIESVIIEPGGYLTDFFNKIMMPGDEKILAEYGEMAKAPEQMMESMGEMFKGPDAPKPQYIADAVKKLIDMEAGKRPLRTVVDVMTGQITEELNKASDKAQAEMMKAFGPN